MKRNEIENQFKWNLKDIYEDEKAWKKDQEKAISLLENIKKLEGTLTSSSKHLLECLTLNDEVSLIAEKLYTYAGLKRDEDTAVSSAQALMDKAENIGVKISSETSFIVPEILELTEEKLEEFYKETPELLEFKKIFESILRDKEHILTKEQEEILSLTSEMASVPSTVFNLLNNADISFPLIKNEKGEEVKLTISNYSTFMDSENREVRKAAFEALYSTYIGFKNTIAATLHANIKQNVMYAKLRKYNSALESSLFSDNVSKDVYENLIKTVRDNLKPMYKYMGIRKEMLGVKDLHMYDIYTPIVSEVDQKITFDQAYETMIEGLSVLGDEYIETLKKAKTDGWIDVYENEGKKSGAYQWGPYGVHPFVLLNHREDLDSMFTLAHEMGHAMHSYFSDRSNPHMYAQYTIFVAEVASTVNEVLLMQHLLNKTDDKKMKMYLINHFLKQFRGTIYRQTMFAEFEKITHEKVASGIPMTSETFSEIYSELNQKYYGENVIQDEEIQYEWMRIPHFYGSFYVYKYATGFSAAIAIAKRILTEGEKARDEYLAFLQSGGTDYPIELLKIAGVDMSTPKPIEDALAYFKELVNELESLI